MEIEFFKPTLNDIVSMQELVKDEVENGIILLRTSDEMATTIRSYNAVKVNGKLAGFCALHIHSVNLAEIRSLIVHRNFRKLKLGTRLVRNAIEEGISLNIKEVLSLTYQQSFFEYLDFKVISKESIPEHKIWADCIRCKRFPICDEIALIYKIA